MFGSHLFRWQCLLQWFTHVKGGIVRITANEGPGGGSELILFRENRYVTMIISRYMQDEIEVGVLIDEALCNVLQGQPYTSARCPQCRVPLDPRLWRSEVGYFSGRTYTARSSDEEEQRIIPGQALRPGEFLAVDAQEFLRKLRGTRPAHDPYSERGRFLSIRELAEKQEAAQAEAAHAAAHIGMVTAYTKHVPPNGHYLNTSRIEPLQPQMEQPKQHYLQECCSACGGELVEAMLFTSKERRCKDCGQVPGSET